MDVLAGGGALVLGMAVMRSRSPKGYHARKNASNQRAQHAFSLRAAHAAYIV
jgi:hypothetical protein